MSAPAGPPHLQHMRIDQLKRMLRERRLRVSGSKQELVDRLLAADASLNVPPDVPAAAGDGAHGGAGATPGSAGVQPAPSAGGLPAGASQPELNLPTAAAASASPSSSSAAPSASAASSSSSAAAAAAAPPAKKTGRARGGGKGRGGGAVDAASHAAAAALGLPVSSQSVPILPGSTLTLVVTRPGGGDRVAVPLTRETQLMLARHMESDATARVRVACMPCHRSKAACDRDLVAPMPTDGRPLPPDFRRPPCSRCARLGRPDDCVDRPPRTTTSVACTNCVAARRSCDLQRPCARCRERDMVATCTDRQVRDPASPFGRPRAIAIAAQLLLPRRSSKRPAAPGAASDDAPAEGASDDADDDAGRAKRPRREAGSSRAAEKDAGQPQPQPQQQQQQPQQQPQQ